MNAHDAGPHRIKQRRHRHQQLQGAAAIALITGILCTGAPAQGRAEPGARVDIGTHHLYIECAGTGTPVVIFESGVGGRTSDWAPVRDAVRTLTRSCVYDRAGYGRSDQSPRQANAENAADDLARLLRAAGEHGPYIITAHSYGGFIARLATHRPDIEVAGLVLLDTSHEDQFETLEQLGAQPLAPPGPDSGGTTRVRTPAQVHTPGPNGARARVRTVLETRAARNEIAALRASARQMRQTRSLTPPTPTVVLWRSTLHDSPRERQWAQLQRELAKRLKTVYSGRVPHAGHAIHIDRPDTTRGVLIAMIRATRTPAQAQMTRASR